MVPCTSCGRFASVDQIVSYATQETVNECGHCRWEEQHRDVDPNPTVYRGSDGRFYGDVDIWDRLESRTWAPCCWDEQTGVEWVETKDEQLLVLIPTAQSALPAKIQAERIGGGIRLHCHSFEPDHDQW